MIKAGVAATLAPFLNPEKPQVFPRPAARFIKTGRYLRNLGVARGGRCAE